MVRHQVPALGTILAEESVTQPKDSHHTIHPGIINKKLPPVESLGHQRVIKLQALGMSAVQVKVRAITSSRHQAAQGQVQHRK